MRRSSGGTGTAAAPQRAETTAWRRRAPGAVLILLILGTVACERAADRPGGEDRAWRLTWAGRPRDSLTVGDPLRVRVSGVVARDAQVAASPWDALPAHWTVRELNEPARRSHTDSLDLWSQTAELAPFRTGEVTLGPLQVPVVQDGDTVRRRSDSLSITVASVLGDSLARADLRDIKPPVPLGGGRPWWHFALAGSALLALAAALFLWLRRRRLRRAAAPLPPPWEEFRRGLEELERARLPEQGQWGAHALLLSHLLRRYMERRFGAPVLEMTTFEVRRWIRGADFDLKLEARLLRWMERGDQIKFAGAVPTLSEAAALQEDARRLAADMEALWRRRTGEGLEDEDRPGQVANGASR
ncbi:MAG: hypothetical protein GF355_09805 [Candidatus Eisenbacteria bacterium]|nr:hypothetical protein [Candidatus Eisenbacteria bacterium]